MAWIQLQEFNPFEEWQFSNTAILSTFEYFKFEWITPNTPKLRNYISQSFDSFELFDFKKIVSSSDKSTILYLPSPSIWTERKIAILCPKIWSAALPDYKVIVSYYAA